MSRLRQHTCLQPAAIQIKIGLPFRLIVVASNSERMVNEPAAVDKQYFPDRKIKTEEFRFEDDGRDGVRRAAVLQGMKLLSSSLRSKN